MNSIIPHITAEQMREVDRAMVEDYGIQLIQMMENAGRNLARLAGEQFLNGEPEEKRVAIFAGSGGNGGGAITSARRLHNYGARVKIFLTKPPDEFSGVPRTQLEIVHKMGIIAEMFTEENFSDEFDLIIDGIIGYSLTGNPRGIAAGMIAAANTSKAPVISLDIPSGIDSTTGKIYEPTIVADATMTLALPKTAFLNESTRKFCGKLYLADIGVPPELYSKPSLNLKIWHIFQTDEIIEFAE